MNEHQEQLSIAVAKVAEQGGAAVGTSLGLYQIIVQHKELILTLCTISSVAIAFVGYLTSTALNWYFKKQHLKLAEQQIRRKKDK